MRRIVVPCLAVLTALVMSGAPAEDHTEAVALLVAEGTNPVPGQYVLEGTALFAGTLDGQDVTGATYTCTSEGTHALIIGAGGPLEGTYECTGEAGLIVGSYVGEVSPAFTLSLEGTASTDPDDPDPADLACEGYLTGGRDYLEDSSSFTVVVACVFS